MVAPEAHCERLISRRTAVKGLVGVTLLIGGAGCASGSPPASSSQTPTGAAPTPPPNPTLFTYTGMAGWVFSAAWSPDGKRIAASRMLH